MTTNTHDTATQRTSLLRGQAQLIVASEDVAIARIDANCEDEPIQMPGSVQPHGFFLLLDEQAKLVEGASDNVEEMLGVPWN